MTPAHRREIERRHAVNTAVEAELGSREICARCHGTLATFAEVCSSELTGRCPGFGVVDECRSRHVHKAMQRLPRRRA